MSTPSPSEAARCQVRENECDDINCMLDAPHPVHTEWQRRQIAKQQKARATALSPSDPSATATPGGNRLVEPTFCKRHWRPLPCPEICDIHNQHEPCLTCRAYIAGGL